MFHPLQPCHFIHLQFHRNGEEPFQIETIGQLDCPNVLLANVVKLLQLSAIVAPHDGSLKDASDMSMIGNPRAVVTIFETSDGFSIHVALCCLCQRLNYVHGWSAIEYILQVCKLVSVFQVWLIVNSSLVLFPKRLPIQDDDVKNWNLNPQEIDSFHCRHSECLLRRLFFVCSIGGEMASCKSTEFPLISECLQWKESISHRL